MRDSENEQESFFSYVSLERQIPDNHPLRKIKTMVDHVLEQMHGYFSDLYSHTGRPSIAPEYLLRASLLQVFYTIRSEQLLMEQLDKTFCSDGLSVSLPMTRFGIILCFPRTGINCSIPKLHRFSSVPFRIWLNTRI